MAKRIITKIGDIFCVKTDNGCIAYFQYIANDMTQLNSSVIRVFKKRYPIDNIFNVEEVISDEVQFYAHTVLKLGISDNIWCKIGESDNIGNTKNVMFRLYEDDDNDTGKSFRWYVWKINKNEKKIGELDDFYRLNTDMGYVYPYFDIVEKINKGKYADEDMMI